MIIASSVKKETCIPLEPLTSNHFSQPKEEETHVTAQPRAKTQNDTMTQVFGQTGLHTQVNQTLSITGSIAHKTLNCEAFLVNETVFLSSPSIGLLNWAGHEFQSCITHLIEMAEQKTGCTALIFMLNRHIYKDSISTVLRAFMYLGFEIIHPARYDQDPAYILVGYEL